MHIAQRDTAFYFKTRVKRHKVKNVKGLVFRYLTVGIGENDLGGWGAGGAVNGKCVWGKGAEKDIRETTNFLTHQCCVMVLAPYKKINLTNLFCFRVPCLFFAEQKFSPLISYYETSINWLAKDRGHTIFNGNQNCIVAYRVSCLFQTVGTAVGICTLLCDGHVNGLFFLVIEPLYNCREGDKKV